MKVLILLSLFSVFTFASEVHVFLNEKYETSYLIKKPRHNSSNLLFNYNSNENGVCKALGYEKAATGSARYSDKLTVLKVDKMAM
jgi:hypothetical protein